MDDQYDRRREIERRGARRCARTPHSLGRANRRPQGSDAGTAARVKDTAERLASRPMPVRLGLAIRSTEPYWNQPGRSLSG